MKRFFINYEDLIENNVINKKIDLSSEDLFIIRKTKNGIYKFEPILYFLDIERDLLKYARTLNYNKKGILMVELTKNEIKKIDPLFIKTYESINDKEYIKTFNKREVKLINYKTYVHMNDEEINTGNIVAVMPCIDDNNKFYISADRSALLNDVTIEDRREFLQSKNIGSDLYFHTDNEDVLEKYKDEITELKEEKSNQFDIKYNKLFVIDSIPSDRLYNLTKDNYRSYGDLMNKAIPVSIEEDYEKYYLSTNEFKNHRGRGYIITNDNLDTMLYQEGVIPLLKYVNIYEYNGSFYKKIPFNDYIKTMDINKYIKKIEKN